MALKDKKLKMPPTVEEPMVKKKVKSKNKDNANESYERYIFKVLRQVHPKMRISKQAMAVMQSCVTDTFDRIAMEANRLCRQMKHTTMTHREIQSAVRLVFPGELSKHAVSEGCKAVMMFNAKGET
mmetsp:Transcript_40103/g.87594  ORF Transcript_40103/g.87594 Transcript_40103/m.87594 type:complete len:126 (-) Transcript_40103:251-628(-)|eukprot:CAMPEP_0170611040 /NCGR_PEP_ID=MMETSP0224-20130122/22978_1 /TAXON_ID=285029 /ORGANISM="Togula jolla, Strain CCCM 725" /LENGTH=125 /DNA_ID=CAMNT_0010936451 /DNA_START=93 /DNA_END=470 /DNA_ORIENTATION=+